MRVKISIKGIAADFMRLVKDLEIWIFICNEKTVHLSNTSGRNKTDSIPSLPENTVKEHQTNPWATSRTHRFESPDLEQIKLACAYVQSGARAIWVLFEGEGKGNR